MSPNHETGSQPPVAKHPSTQTGRREPSQHPSQQDRWGSFALLMFPTWTVWWGCNCNSFVLQVVKQVALWVISYCLGRKAALFIFQNPTKIPEGTVGVDQLEEVNGWIRRGDAAQTPCRDGFVETVTTSTKEPQRCKRGSKQTRPVEDMQDRGQLTSSSSGGGTANGIRAMKERGEEREGLTKRIHCRRHGRGNEDCKNFKTDGKRESEKGMPTDFSRLQCPNSVMIFSPCPQRD